MPEKDYYKILGVNKDASDADIKKAYRKLAMKYHPDHAKGDRGSEDRFKEISEAYAVLSDKEKRRQYDTYGSNGFQQRYSQEDIFKNFDFSDIFKEFGFGGPAFNFFSSQGSGGGRGFNYGGGGSPFGSRVGRHATQMKGSDLVYELPLTLGEVATGTSKTITFQHKGRSENITVKIPRGMITGKKLRISGKGEESSFGGPPGDLFIQSKVQQDPLYDTDGFDLYLTREVKLSDTLLGRTISVPTLDGRELSLRIPPGTKHKTKMRLSGHGLPHMQGNGHGDLYVSIQVNTPANLTDHQKRLVQELAEAGL